MSSDHLTLCGFSIPVAVDSSSEQSENVGSSGRTITGGSFLSQIASRERFQYQTIRTTLAEAQAIRSLLRPGMNGEVWAFTDSDGTASTYGSKGTPIVASSGFSTVTTWVRFGQDALQVTAQPIDMLVVRSEYTIGMWHAPDTTTSFAHYVFKSDGARFVDGVRDDTATLPFDVVGDTVRLTVDGYYDDIVYIPIEIPDDWPGEWDTLNAFPALPNLRLGGEGYDFNLIVDADPGSIVLKKSKKLTASGLVQTASVDFTLIGLAREDNLVTTLPDLTGLTRIEWTADDLALNHLDQVASWVDRGSSLDAVQATSAKQPVYRTDAADKTGKAVRFDNTDDWLKTATGLAIDMSGGCTIFVAMQRFTPNENFKGFLRCEDSSNNHVIMHTGSATTGYAWVYVNRGTADDANWALIDTTLVTSADPTMWSARLDSTLDPADSPVRIDGQVPASIGEAGAIKAPQNAIDMIALGLGVYDTKPFNGDIFTLAIYYGRLMTTAEVFRIESILNNRHGIY